MGEDHFGNDNHSLVDAVFDLLCVPFLQIEMMYEYRAEIVRAIDGDTLECLVDLGFSVYEKMHLRLSGIDAPEKRGASREAGLAAMAWVEKWIEEVNGRVLIKTERDRKEKYGRYLAIVFQQDSGRCLNREIIAAGHAVEAMY